MRIIARRTLCEFYSKPEYKDSKIELESWFHIVKKTDWKNSAELKEQFRSASIITSNRVVFNICGNKYRLVVSINYITQIVYGRFIGTHKEYDNINVKKV